MKRMKPVTSSRRIVCGTMDNASLDEVASLIANKVGSRADVQPAYVMNLGDGTAGVIYENSDGFINLVLTESQSSAFEARDTIATVLNSWGKDASEYQD